MSILKSVIILTLTSVGDSWVATEVHCFPASSASQDQCANHVTWKILFITTDVKNLHILTDDPQADGKLQPIAEHVHHKRAAEVISQHFYFTHFFDWNVMWRDLFGNENFYILEKGGIKNHLVLNIQMRNLTN